MNIIWNQNPLKTIIELDDKDKLLFREKYKSYYLLEDTICRMVFALRNQSHLGKPLSPEETIKKALSRVDLDYLLGDTKHGDQSFEEYIDDQSASYIEALTLEHDGDCICVACSCTKCFAEGVLGVDTLKGLGKHEASQIGGYFTDGATIDEVIEKLKEYKPVYTPHPNWKEEDWKKHIPRWTEEGKQAHAWLTKYRDEHFKK